MTPSDTEKIIKGVVFDPVVHRSARRGDNWCLTWADDDCQYTSCDDGWGWDFTSPDKPVWINYLNNRVWRLRGNSHDFTPEYLPHYPFYHASDEWYGYGIVCVGATLYHFLTCATNHGFGYPFRGAKLLYSRDHGDSWLLHDGKPIYLRERDPSREAMFFWQEEEDYAFSNIEFLQCGRNNELAKDDYVYLYSPNGRYHMHELNCARVPRDRLTDRAAYEFFTELNRDGGAGWTKDIGRRGFIHAFPKNYGWYSWLPSVVYNKGLDLYIMANGGTGVNGSGMHELPASLGLYYARNPWGPWTEIFYTDAWVADKAANRLYQPKLSPKWISEDGREMTLIFSDASDNWGYQYRWNQQKITLIL